MIKTLECTIVLEGECPLSIKVQYDSGREYGDHFVLEVIEMLQAISGQQNEPFLGGQLSTSDTFTMPTAEISIGSAVAQQVPTEAQYHLAGLVSKVMPFFTLDPNSESSECHILGAAELVIG